MKCPKCQAKNTDTARFCSNCATSLTSADDAQPSFTRTLETPVESLTRGTLFADRYEIIEELGKGGMGAVYRAEDTKVNEEIAIKLIKPEIAAEKKTIERFKNELTTARQISHRNVCRMFDLGESEGTHYLTMELVSGEDLKSLISRIGRMPIVKALDIGRQICGGLIEAHNLGIVHRDLKPGNIMIDKAGNAKIMDFGIARSGETSKVTGTGVIIGTPEYMSPEQAEAEDIDPRSDIYSLGIILYEMVTGQVPFTGKSGLSVAMKQKGELPKNPQEINPQVPDELGELILKCLAKNREQRYASAEELKLALDDLVRLLPSTQAQISRKKAHTSKEVTVTFSPRKLLVPALVLVALVVAVVMLIWKPWSQNESVLISQDKSSIAIMYFKNSTGNENLDFWSSALSDSITTDLSQSKFVRVLSSPDLFSILRGLNLHEAKAYASEDLRKVAIEGKVNHILQGSLSKAGDTFRIDYTIHDMNTGTTVSAARVEGTGEESIFSMVDDLTKEIKASLELSEEQISSDLDRDVGNITTNSPEAYRHYIEGVTSYFKGDKQKPLELFEKAIAIDPEFAMAYKDMAAVYSSLGIRSEENKCLQKALELSDRISVRERYKIQAAFYRLSEKTYDRAVEAYSQYLMIYPDDWRAKNNLGLIYNRLGQRDNAEETFRSIIEDKVEFYAVYTNLSVSYSRKGLYTEAQDVLEYYLSNISEHAGIHNYLRRNYLSQGKYDLALIEFDKGFALNPAYFIHRYYRYFKGDLYLLMGNVSEAKKEYEKYEEGNEPVALAWGRERLANLHIIQGNFEKAKEQVLNGIELAKKAKEKAVELPLRGYLAYIHTKSRNYMEALEEINRAGIGFIELDSISGQMDVFYRKGLIYLQMKRLNEAQKEADELLRLIEEGLNKEANKYYYHLIGMLELNREGYSKSIEYFKEALALEPHGLQKNAEFIESLARAYLSNGELDKAEDEYVRITTLTTGRLYSSDIYVKSFFMLGQIYEQQGNSTKAIEHYERFLNLWKNADPGLPEVSDARERLAALRQ